MIENWWIPSEPTPIDKIVLDDINSEYYGMAFVNGYEVGKVCYNNRAKDENCIVEPYCKN